MKLYKSISGGAIVTATDFDNNVPCNTGKGGDFGSGWYAINDKPEHPTHTFVNGLLMTFGDADSIGESALNNAHPELNP